jgi:hypothetical protein
VFLPSKFVSADQALVTLGGQVLVVLEQSKTISSTWEAVKDWRIGHGIDAPVPFWWFAIALDTLYAMGVISLTDGLLRREALAQVAK